MKKMLNKTIAPILTAAMVVGVFFGGGQTVKAANTYQFIQTTAEEDSIKLPDGLGDGTIISKDDVFEYSYGVIPDSWDWNFNSTFLWFMDSNDQTNYLAACGVNAGDGELVTTCVDMTSWEECNIVDAYNAKCDGNYSHVKVTGVMYFYQDDDPVMLMDTDVNVTSSEWILLVEGYNPPTSDTNEEETNSKSSHAHAFSWQTIREATKDSDGLAQYRCSCGAVEGEQVISKTATTYTGLLKALKNAQAGEHVVYDSGEMFTLSDIMLEQLSQKKDVSAAIDFKYKNKEYTLTIPAGMDYTKFFADKEFFYGFLYFAQETDATVVEK